MNKTNLDNNGVKKKIKSSNTTLVYIFFTPFAY